jgi:hypothetical protein
LQTEVVSPGDWFVSSNWFLPSTGQVAFGTWDNSLTVCARWSDLLFSPGGHCIALPLKLCLVSFFPSKMWQYSFEYHPQSHKTSSGIYQGCTSGGWLVAPPLLPALCTLPHLCWLLVLLFWEVGLSPHPHSQALLLVPPSFTDSLAPCPTLILWCRFGLLPHPHCWC